MADICTTQTRQAFSDTLIRIQVLFKGLDCNPVDVANPRVRIFHGFEKTPVDVDILKTVQNTGDHSYPLEPVDPPQTGQYRFAFLTTWLMPGLYNLEFAGDITETLPDTTTRQKTLIVKGELEIGEISRLHDVINRVQMGLMDDFPYEYRLDEPVHQWKKDQIYNYIREALSRFNSTGPRRTSFDIDSFPYGNEELLVTGAKIWALYGRSRLEKANEMNYSDVHTLNIDRASMYKQMADTLMQDWTRAVQDWKKMTPPTPIGLRSQRLPFRVSRVIGLLPNYQTFFSG